MAGSRALTVQAARRRVALDPWLVVAGAVGLIALVVIRSTLLPGVWFWDTAEAQTVPPLFGTMHPTGFPAYVVVGWLASTLLAPFGEPAFRMNLLSAILVAAAAGGSVLVARELRVPGPLATAAGIGLAFTPIVWAIGTSADAHALHLALVVLLTLLLLGWERRVRKRRAAIADASPPPHADRWLVAAAAVFGVSAANHSLTLLLVVPVAAYVLAVDVRVLARPRLVLACLAAVVGVAGLLYLQLPLRAGPFPAPIVYGRPDTWEGFRYIVLAEQFRGSIVDPFGDLGRKAEALLRLAGEQLGALALLVPAGFGVALARAPRYALLSGLAVAITCFFAASYVNADISRYYLGPAFFAWTWLALLGAWLADAAGALASGTGREAGPAGAGGGPVSVVVAGVLAVGLLAPTALALPERHRELDRSSQTAAREWLDAAFAAFEEDAVVVSWWSYSTTMWYGQLVEGRRPDIAIVDDRTRLDENLGEVTDVVDAHLGRRPVYLVRLSEAEIAQLATRYALQPLGAPANAYRVLERLEATTR